MGPSADYGGINLQNAFNASVIGNYFEHSPGRNVPHVVLGVSGTITGMNLSQNSFGGGSASTLILIGTFGTGRISNNVFTSTPYAIDVTGSIANSTIEDNQLNGSTALLTPAVATKSRGVRIKGNSIDVFGESGVEYYLSNEKYFALKSQLNSSVRGDMPAI